MLVKFQFGFLIPVVAVVGIKRHLFGRSSDPDHAGRPDPIRILTSLASRPRHAGPRHLPVPPGHLGAWRPDPQPGRPLHRGQQHLPGPDHQRLQPVAQPLDRAWATSTAGDATRCRRPARMGRGSPSSSARRRSAGSWSARILFGIAALVALWTVARRDDPAGLLVGRAGAGGRLLRAADPRARALPLPGARAGGPAGGPHLEVGGALRRPDPLLLRERLLALHHRLLVRRRRLPDEPWPLPAADAARPGPRHGPLQRHRHLPPLADDRDRAGLAPDPGRRRWRSAFREEGQLPAAPRTELPPAAAGRDRRSRARRRRVARASRPGCVATRRTARSRRDAWIGSTCSCWPTLVVAAFFFRLWRLEIPRHTHFDEVYHARSATEWLADWQEGWTRDTYEWTHPPLAKYLIAAGIVVADPNKVVGGTDLDAPATAIAVAPQRTAADPAELDRLHLGR